MQSFPAEGKRKPIISSKRKRSGLTRLEVVLVFSVILLNVAVFLPFVQHAQEASRKTQCKNNLKQIGLAIANYQDAFNRYPAGFEVRPDGNYFGWGWNVRILPFMDAKDVYQKFEPHFATGIHGLPDSSEFKLRLPFLICPSDSELETVPHAMIVNAKVANSIVPEGVEDWPDWFPRSSYFGNAGYLQLEAGGLQYNDAAVPTSIVPLVNKGSLGNIGTTPSQQHRYCDQKHFGGYFGQNSFVKIEQVTDGTSNTIMFGERYSPVGSHAGAVGHGTWIGVTDCSRAQGLALALGDASVRINIGMPLREQTTGFGSRHDDGVFFAIGDGSVKFISQNIDVVMFRNLSVIDDGSR